MATSRAPTGAFAAPRRLLIRSPGGSHGGHRGGASAEAPWVPTEATAAAPRPKPREFPRRPPRRLLGRSPVGSHGGHQAATRSSSSAGRPVCPWTRHSVGGAEKHREADAPPRSRRDRHDSTPEPPSRFCDLHSGLGAPSPRSAAPPRCGDRPAAAWWPLWEPEGAGSERSFRGREASVGSCAAAGIRTRCCPRSCSRRRSRPSRRRPGRPRCPAGSSRSRPDRHRPRRRRACP
jgi:hypothetical protein